MALWGLLAIIPLYFLNTFGTAHLPILGNYPYDKFGARYNVSRVVDPGTLNFNQTMYDSYPLKLSIGTVLRDMSFLMSNGAMLSYVFLYHRHEVMDTIRKWRNPKRKDIHNRLMGAYEEVPEWYVNNTQEYSRTDADLSGGFSWSSSLPSRWVAL